MRFRYLSGLGALLVVVGACSSGGDERPGKINETPTGGRTGNPRTGGTGNDSGGEGGTANGANGGGGFTSGGEGGEGIQVSPAGPTTTIVSPAGTANPTAETVLHSGRFEVVCEAVQSNEPGALDVDPASVKIAVLDEDGDVIQELPAAPTRTPNEYSADLTLPADAPNGPVGLRCTATDVSPSPLAGSSTVTAYVDNGPLIEIGTPERDSAEAVTGAVTFEFTAAPWELIDDDAGAAVATVELSVDGQDIELGEGETPDTYRASVDFQDRTVFPEPPTGSTPVVLRATNERGVERVLHYTFLLDGEGPVIRVTSPSANAIVSEQVVLTFTVEDELSSVDPDTVFVDIGSNSYQYDPTGDWTLDGNRFTFTFDETALGSAQWQVTLNLRAEDLAGNPADTTSHILLLDYEPPWISLDPPMGRDIKEGTTDTCSARYDPLGSGAANDRSEDDLNLKVRALVWDMTNNAGQEWLWHAGVDRERVDLYLQVDVDAGVLEDTTGDGICDEIVDRDDLPIQNLTALDPSGSAQYGNGDDFALAPNAEGCATGNANTIRPLCSDQSSDMFRIPHHGLTSATEPVVYAVRPTSNVCTGQEWEVSQNVHSDGWVCLATRAVDKAGNIGVSPPLRLCIDVPSDPGTPNCDPDTAPTCRANCANPPTVGALAFPG